MHTQQLEDGAMHTPQLAELEQHADVRFDHIVKQRHGPGVLVIAPPMRVVYVNRQAWEYAKHLDDGTGISESGPLPIAITRLCADIQQALRARTSSGFTDQLEVSRVAGHPDHPVLLRGFGVPGYNGHQAALVLILLEEVGRRQRPVGEVSERFQLTVREKAVVEHLAKGLTNKEIASLLGIAEPTVKDHIKRIMQKTQSRTRTEILANLLSPLDKLA